MMMNRYADAAVRHGGTKRAAGALACAALAVLLIFTGTGRDAHAASAGILPSKITDIQSGGKIPAGAEAKAHDNSDYLPVLFSGKFVLAENAAAPEETPVSVKTDEGDYRIGAFPVSIEFGEGGEFSFGYETVPLADIPYCQAEFPVSGQSGQTVTIRAGYDTDGDMLALGLTEYTVNILNGVSEIKETGITELDYQIEWKGTQLTLSSGGESAVYTADGLMLDENGLPDISAAAPAPESEVESAFQVIGMERAIAADGERMETGITFNEDGSAVIGEHTGGTISSYPAWFIGPQYLVFVREDGKREIYKVEGPMSDLSMELMMPPMIEMLHGSAVFIDGTRTETYASFAVKKALENGYTTDADPEMQVESRTVSDPFDLTMGGASLHARAVNPYEFAAPLSECLIASVTFDAGDGNISYSESLVTGESTHADVKNTFGQGYEDTGDRLTYKTRAFAGILSMDIENLMEEPYGETLIENDQDLDLSFLFDEKETLTGMSFVVPSLLYSGLQDNLSREELENLDPNAAGEVIGVRDEILAALVKEFADAGVDVEVDETTGTVRMASEVLFKSGSFSISKEGKKYIDSFIGAYAKVLLGGDFKEKIERIEISGHTDNEGTYENNLYLSEKRAEAALKYCLESKENGMDDAQRKAFESLTESAGYSYSDPIFVEDSDQIDMDASRRVEIRFFLKMG